MSLQEQPSSERIHIAFFGVRNAGKSSLVNAVTGQDLSVVSEVGGTTTDPVQRAMELLPLGPVVIIDTPGTDDAGVLGGQRVERARNVLRRAEIAVLVISAGKGPQETDLSLIRLFRERKMPHLVVLNKADLAETKEQLSALLEQCRQTLLQDAATASEPETAAVLAASALTGQGIQEVREALGRLMPEAGRPKVLAEDLAERGDYVILVTPIDASAPKNRIILPQQMVIRSLLDVGAVPVVCRETEYTDTLASLGKKPRLVITDSQVFGLIDRETPAEIPLTSFSILMARYRGTLESAVRGAHAMRALSDGNTVLISEGCTHHRQCGDIGTVKMPEWIRKFTGKELRFVFTAGGSFPSDLSDVSLIVHCGGCMLNEKEMQSRMAEAASAGVAMTNYGIAIAMMHGILDRSIEVFVQVCGR